MMYKTHIVVAKATATTTIIASAMCGILPRNLLLHIHLAPECAIAAGLLYEFTCWGSEYPDMDLPNSKASKKNFINRFISKMLANKHLHHRSKETHSIDLCTLKCLGLYFVLFYLTKNLEVSFIKNFHVLNILLYIDKYVGLCVFSIWLGMVCHIVADFFTQQGAYIFSWLPKVRVVPSDFGWGDWKPFKKFFSTGDDSAWELGFRSVVTYYYKATLIGLLVVFILPI